MGSDENSPLGGWGCNRFFSAVGLVHRRFKPWTDKPAKGTLDSRGMGKKCYFKRQCYAQYLANKYVEQKNGDR
jgi:hypothetical protein